MSTIITRGNRMVEELLNALAEDALIQKKMLTIAIVLGVVATLIHIWVAVEVLS